MKRQLTPEQLEKKRAYDREFARRWREKHPGYYKEWLESHKGYHKEYYQARKAASNTEEYTSIE
jgi:hypothetical protein